MCIPPCPAVRAERLCPNAVFLPPDFPRYGLIQTTSLLDSKSDVFERLLMIRNGSQTSRGTLFPGEPVAIVHMSADGHWYFIVSWQGPRGYPENPSPRGLPDLCFRIK